MDEHRIGLKPVTRRVWAPIGERPIAHGHHRFDCLYITAFASPATGETFWYLSRNQKGPRTIAPDRLVDVAADISVLVIMGGPFFKLELVMVAGNQMSLLSRRYTRHIISTPSSTPRRARALRIAADIFYEKRT
jgi:hypothetical protein